MDFVHDPLFDGRSLRLLTVVYQWNREAVLIEPRFSFWGQDVAGVLDRWVATHGKPVSITVDHGTEFTSKAVEAWARRRGVKLDFIHAGKPMENRHIESFNGAVAGRMFERASVSVPGRCTAEDRSVAHGL